MAKYAIMETVNSRISLLSLSEAVAFKRRVYEETHDWLVGNNLCDPVLLDRDKTAFIWGDTVFVFDYEVANQLSYLNTVGADKIRQLANDANNALCKFNGCRVSAVGTMLSEVRAEKFEKFTGEIVIGE